MAQLLQTQAPAAYWESHAGAADYVLTHSLARNYGAYYFFYNAHRSERLLCTPYYEILRSLASGVDEPRTYPGSPLIAMRMLKDAASRFLFCDVDQDSLSTIHRRADELKLAARRNRTRKRSDDAGPRDPCTVTSRCAAYFRSPGPVSAVCQRPADHRLWRGEIALAAMHDPDFDSTQALWAAVFFAATSPRMLSCLARSWGRSWVASTRMQNSLTDPQAL